MHSEMNNFSLYLENYFLYFPSWFQRLTKAAFTCHNKLQLILACLLGEYQPNVV